MSGGLMIDDIIMTLFMNITEKLGRLVGNCLFYKINHDKIYLYKGSIQDYSWNKKLKTPKQCYVHIITLTRKYLNVWVVYYLQCMIRQS